jgi:hypothetical protein
LEAVERLKKKYRRLVGNIGKTNWRQTKMPLWIMKFVLMPCLITSTILRWMWVRLIRLIFVLYKTKEPLTQLLQTIQNKNLASQNRNPFCLNRTWFDWRAVTWYYRYCQGN